MSGFGDFNGRHRGHHSQEEPSPGSPSNADFSLREHDTSSHSHPSLYDHEETLLSSSSQVRPAAEDQQQKTGDKMLVLQLQEKDDTEISSRFGYSKHQPFPRETYQGMRPCSLKDDAMPARNIPGTETAIEPLLDTGEYKYNGDGDLKLTNVLVERDPVKDDLLIKSFAQQMRRRVCSSGCGASLLPRFAEAASIFHSWLRPWSQTPFASPVIRCGRQCWTYTCMGCGSRESQRGYCSKMCAKGGIFVVWMLLCGLDHAREAELDNVKELQTVTVMDERDGYTHPKGRGAVQDIGHGSNPQHHVHSSTYAGASSTCTPCPINIRERIQKQTDAKLSIVLDHLKTILDVTTQSLNEDAECRELLVAMLFRSSILDKLAELLRNDSITEILKRQMLYDQAIKLVRTIAGHPYTRLAVLNRRAVRAKDGNLHNLSFDRASLQGLESAHVDTRPSIAHAVQNIGVQCAAFLKNARQNPAELSSKDGPQIMRVCEAMVDVATDLKDSGLDVAMQRQQPSVASDTYKAMEEWHREHCVEDLPDEAIFSRHHFAMQAELLVTSPLGRLKTLMLQLANMKTSLPQGIYVRHGSSRMDFMKVLIIGPRGTPYENGLFEFDLFCGIAFPSAPPLVFFRGACGPTSINPNLYPDGKVCLSLLGTWPGEPWLPFKSTLYQVLVSIQAMVFCEEPWYNEPSHDSLRHAEASGLLSTRRGNELKDRSALYGKQVRRLTVHHALLRWFKGTSGIWKDVVEHHWRTNGPEILATVRKWAQDDADFANHFQRVHLGISTPGLPHVGNVSPFAMQIPGQGTLDIGLALPQLESALGVYVTH